MQYLHHTAPMFTTTPADLLSPTPGYSARASLATAELSVATYAPAALAIEAAKSAGYDDAEVITSGCSSVLLAWSMSAGVIAIVGRGSSTLGEWLDDMAFLPIPWRFLFARGLICRGFRRHTKRLLPSVISRVTELIESMPTTADTRIVLTGHSLGATMAALIATYLHHCAASSILSSIYLHESPRMMTKTAALYYDSLLKSRTFRVVMVQRGEQDLVTRLPPSRWGIWHIGTPEVIEDGIRYETETDWERVRAMRKIGLLEGLYMLYSKDRARAMVRAHYGNYLVQTLRMLAKY